MQPPLLSLDDKEQRANAELYLASVVAKYCEGRDEEYSFPAMRKAPKSGDQRFKWTKEDKWRLADVYITGVATKEWLSNNAQAVYDASGRKILFCSMS